MQACKSYLICNGRSVGKPGRRGGGFRIYPATARQAREMAERFHDDDDDDEGGWTVDGWMEDVKSFQAWNSSQGRLDKYCTSIPCPALPCLVLPCPHF